MGGWIAGEYPNQGLMDRLVELERFQLVTEEWEAKKLRYNGGMDN